MIFPFSKTVTHWSAILKYALKPFFTEIELFDQMAKPNYVTNIIGPHFCWNYQYWLEVLFFPLSYNVPDRAVGYLRSKEKTKRQMLNWFVRVNAMKRNNTPTENNYEDGLLKRKRCLLRTHFAFFPNIKKVPAQYFAVRQASY